MPNSPLVTAGAQVNPIASAALHTNRFFSGLWTQRVPFRDAAVPDLYEKFYSATRFESIDDGLNVEMTVRLSIARRSGNSQYNTNTFPAIKSFYGFKYINDNVENIIVLADGSDGNIYNATAGTKATIYTKSTGAGPMNFLGLNQTCYMTDGIDEVEWMINQAWEASTDIQPGTLITVGAAPGTVQMALGGISMGIVQIQALTETEYQIWFDLTQTQDQFPNLVNAELAFSGLTAVPSLNGTSLPVSRIVSTTLGILIVSTTGLTAGNAMAETGAASTGSGTTGSSAPSFSSTKLAVTTDSGQQWKCYGSAILPWGLQTPTQSLVIASESGSRYWQNGTVLSYQYAIMDVNGNIQAAMGLTAGAGGIYKTGNQYPTWTTGAPAGQFNQTIDGTILWWNLGAPGYWYVDQTYYTDPSQGVACILDSNQNLQWLSSGSGGTSGGSEPTWSQAIGTTTTDGALTWTCLGPGVILFGSKVSYAYSLHGIDGTVSSASTSVIIQGYVLGQSQANPPVNPSLSLTIKNILNYGSSGTAAGVDQIWIWRTAQGQSTLLLEDQIPIDDISVHPAPPDHPTEAYNFLTYSEYGIGDISTNGNGALNALIEAPISDEGDAPPSGLSALIYAFERIWGAVNNTVQWSAGPDATTGNGNTQWPPLNVLPYPGKVLRLVPVTVENGGILVFTTSGIYIILGTGTESNPFYSTLYCAGINLAGYNALDVFGSVIYLMEANGKVSSITIEYPFNPQSGYTEVGMPIGDQFQKVTTGGINTALYTPANTYLNWCLRNTQDTGMYVSDGATGWFRLNMVAAPETGEIWSPRAAIEGGTSAVQTVETSPGVFDLLIGPASSGSILRRDNTTCLDGVEPYPAYATFGSIVVAQPGSSIGLRYIVTEELVAGTLGPNGPTPCAVGVLLDEIGRNQYYPQTFRNLIRRHNDPPNLPPSQSIISNRFYANQQGQPLKCRHLQVMVSWGAQNFANELWTYSIYARLNQKAKT